MRHNACRNSGTFLIYINIAACLDVGNTLTNVLSAFSKGADAVIWVAYSHPPHASIRIYCSEKNYISSVVITVIL